MMVIPAPRMTSAPTAPAAVQRSFAPPSINATMRAPVQRGVCSNPVKTNGTTCNDGNACTTSDVCTNGTCGGTAVVCTALDQCHDAGTCSGGVCSNPVKTNGTTCNDGNACTEGDVCTNGTCVAGAAKDCNDNNACTTDTCIPATGCVYTLLANIDDGDAGTIDACNPATGVITHTPSGSFDGSGTVGVTDALKALRIASELDTPTAADLKHADVAPLVNGTPAPDGKIDIGDVVVILRKALGLIPSW